MTNDLNRLLPVAEPKEKKDCFYFDLHSLILFVRQLSEYIFCIFYIHFNNNKNDDVNRCSVYCGTVRSCEQNESSMNQQNHLEHVNQQ